jgi:hypothetical protein
LRTTPKIKWRCTVIFFKNEKIRKTTVIKNLTKSNMSQLPREDPESDDEDVNEADSAAEEDEEKEEEEEEEGLESDEEEEEDEEEEDEEEEDEEEEEEVEKPKKKATTFATKKISIPLTPLMGAQPATAIPISFVPRVTPQPTIQPSFTTQSTIQPSFTVQPAIQPAPAVSSALLSLRSVPRRVISTVSSQPAPAPTSSNIATIQPLFTAMTLQPSPQKVAPSLQIPNPQLWNGINSPGMIVPNFSASGTSSSTSLMSSPSFGMPMVVKKI